MGFEVTATHVIWIVAILSAGTILAPSGIQMAEDLDAARVAAREREQARLVTRVGDASFCYDAVLDLVQFNATNEGRTSLDAAQAVLLVDGRVVTDLDVDNADSPGSELWHPEEVMFFNATGEPAEPDRVSLVTAEGGSWRGVKVDCRKLSTIVVTPSSASLDLQESQVFEAAGYDNFGDPWPTTFTWSIATGTLETLSATSTRFTAGTTAGTFTLTASAEGITGTAEVVIHPGEPASIEVTPAEATVEVGGTYAFTATAKDAYGNVNTTAEVTWTTTAGTIDASGVLTAQTTPANGLSVTATTGTRSDSSNVNVVVGPVARVEVTPANANVATTESQAYTATAYDAYDNVVSDASFTWAATRGSVDAQGVYTAPATTGTDTVTATADGVSGSVDLNVVRRVHVQEIRTYEAGVETGTFNKGDVVETRVTVLDHLGNAVEGATVTLELVDPQPTVQSTGTPATSATGVASHEYTLPKSARQGQWTARVTDVAGTFLVYDSGSNSATSRTFEVRP